MERLNWAVLGLIGIVTALGLGTSNGAGKAKTDEQVVAVTATNSTPACSACQAGGVCGDKSVAAASGSAFVHDTKIVCPGACSEQAKQEVAQVAKNLEALVQAKGPYISDKELDQALKPSNRLVEQHNPATGTTDCPLTKAADAITNLTKTFVCEGGDCLVGKGQGTLTITAGDPAPKPDAPAKPEGLLNLVAAAEVVAANKEVPQSTTTKSENGTVTSTITINSGDLTKAGTGTLTLNVKATDPTTAVAIAQETNTADAKPAVDNSRAAARAAKLAAIEAKMEAPWMLAFNETPLTQAVHSLQEKLGVPVLLDRKALEEAGIEPETPLTADQQPEIESGEFLRGYLRNHNLTWIIPASNDRILVTTLERMESMPITRVYDATDLIDENLGPEALVERIQSLVEPHSWKNSGGSGDLTIWQKGNRVSLICSSTYWTQRAIATLLEDLRLNSSIAGEHAALAAPQDAVAVLRRYELPSLLDVKDRLARQKLLASQKQFFLTLLKDEPGFDPAVFETIEYDNQPLLLTKQSPEIHRHIQKTLKMLEGTPGGASMTQVSKW